MKVKMIYRNYIPLYSGYCSFWMSEIQGIDITIPEPKTSLKRLFKIYKKINNLPLIHIFLEVFQKAVFQPRRSVDKDIDLFFFAGIMPPDNFNKPFVIDLEHVFSIFDFQTPSRKKKNEVFQILKSPYCKKIMPWSRAAQKTLKEFYQDDYKYLKSKTEVVYPALPNYTDIYNREKDNSIVKENKNLKLLFIGRDIYRKGLHEVLPAFLSLYKKHKNIEIHCITNYNDKFKEEYNHPNIHFYPYTFKHTDLIKKFFMTCDLFIMPTHTDTFGMVYLEALSAGLPIIATKQFATPEFLKEGVNGYFVNSKNLFLNDPKLKAEECDKKIEKYKTTEESLVMDIEDKLEYLLNNPNIFKKFKRNSPKEFESGGKFSFKKRNNQLKRIFTEAVKNER